MKDRLIPLRAKKQSRKILLLSIVVSKLSVTAYISRVDNKLVNQLTI